MPSTITLSTERIASSASSCERLNLLRWYNKKKPHMSLSWDGRRYDTRLEAFWYEMDPGRLLGYAQGWLWEETT
ncbi:MAG: hypothetical protein KAU99_04065 [Thermoplasmata archaeon]|nr:hypothetical protein [Thermoplasmata archaeon]